VRTGVRTYQVPESRNQVGMPIVGEKTGGERLEDSGVKDSEALRGVKERSSRSCKEWRKYGSSYS
jgi:hypothetical protein